MNEMQKDRKNRDRSVLLYVVIFLAFCFLALAERSLYRTVVYTGYDTGILQNVEVKNGEYLQITDPDANWIFPDQALFMDAIEVDVEDITSAGGSADLSVRVYYDTGRGYNVDDSALTLITSRDRTSWDRIMTIGKTGRIGSFRLQFGIGADQQFQISRIVVNPAEKGWTFWMLAVIFCGLVLAWIGGRGISAGKRLPLAIAAVVLWSAFFWQASQLRQIRQILLLAVLLLLAELALIQAFRKEDADGSGQKKADRNYLAALLLLTFAAYLVWAFRIPYMDGPDESMRYLVVDYIRSTGRLPRGDDPAVLNGIWGTSYAFNPILPYIAGGYLARIASLFTDSQAAFWNLAKLVNVINGTLLVFWCDRIADLLFPKSRARYLFPVLAAFWPQMAYMATYVNTDSLALMSGAMILYFWIRGIRDGWTGRNCTGLGIGIGLCAMSYYNAYGYILLSIPLFYYSLWRAGADRKQILKGTAIVSGWALAIGAWWFVRNWFLYDGDFLAREASRQCAEANALPEFKPSFKWTWQGAGYSLLDMFRDSDYLVQTPKSFVGAFGQMTIMLHKWQYMFFLAILGMGMLLCFCAVVLYLKRSREERIPVRAVADRFFYYGILALSAAIAGGLALYYAYASDYQPQGRYWLPCFIPLALFACTGFDRAERAAFVREKNIGKSASGILSVLVLFTFLLFAAVLFGIEFEYYG